MPDPVCRYICPRQGVQDGLSGKLDALLKIDLVFLRKGPFGFKPFLPEAKMAL
jgi:hypothetical protein